MHSGKIGRVRAAAIGAVALVVATLAGCATPAKPVYQQQPRNEHVIETYDGTLDPSAAVLPLVPAAATQLEVTDLDQLRLTLGFGELTGRSSAADRDRFWRELPTTASLSSGLLRPYDKTLRARFGFGEDDVVWEATYGGGGQHGWVLAFREDLAMGEVERAVQARVGILKGATVDAADHLVTSAAPPDGKDSWGADPELVALVGRPADATYLARGCLSFSQVYGPKVEGELASGPKDVLSDLLPLKAYAVAFGGELVTAELGAERDDLFTRLHLAGVMPRTKPEDFSAAFARGVADPSTGRLGYQLADPRAAVRLTEQGHLPFAICGQQ